VAGDLNLEVIEGPDAGKQLALDGPIVIGRGADADFVLEDGEASAQHTRVTPSPDGTATVEDLETANGTFVNGNELIGPTHLDADDEILVGVSVIKLRTRDELLRQPSAVIQIPPSLAMAPRAPTYVNPEVAKVETAAQAPAAQAPAPAGHPTVDKYLDVRVRRRANLEPLALFVLVAIVLIIYFASR
jgi:pSer/pThr/pTyr-binding forkhead associated (FHA) protein